MTITRVGAILSAALLLSCSGTIAASAAAPSAVPGLSPGQVQDVLTVSPGLTETQLVDVARQYAYEAQAGIAPDADGGTGVYPVDIYRSDYTTEY